jgi:hypothetical protein
MIFWVLQSFWFRFLIDAKIWEQRHAAPLLTVEGDNSKSRPAILFHEK